MKQMPSSMEECGEKMKDMCRCIDSTIECSGVDSSVSLGVHVSLLFVYKFVYEFADVLVGELQYRVHVHK